MQRCGVDPPIVWCHSDRKYKHRLFDIGLRVQINGCYFIGQSGILVQQQQYGILTRSCGVGTTRVWYLYTLVLARVLCAGHALLVSSYGSAVRQLTTLCPRSSRACSSCSVALKARSCALVVLLVVTATCGQRADALSPLVARSHALVYLWCWHSSMVSILAPARVLLYTFVALVPQYGFCTRSCSVTLKACSCAL